MKEVDLKCGQILCAVAASLWLSTFAHGQAVQPAQTNLVTDGGFEQGAAGWQFLVTSANASGQLDSTTPRSGKYSYKISNKSVYAPNVYARIEQIIAGLRPFTTYRAFAGSRARAAV